MCEWRSASDPKYRCRVPSQDGSRLCIFHESGLKDTDEFRAAIRDQIAGGGDPETSNQMYDFTGYVFPTGVVTDPYFARRGEIVLEIESPARTVILSQARIAGQLLLRARKLSRSLRLDRMTVDGPVQLDDIVVAGDLSLLSTRAAGSLTIRQSDVGGGADMRGLSIAGVSRFETIAVQGSLHLRDSDFGGDAIWEGLSIRGKLDIARATLNSGLAISSSPKLEHVCIDHSRIEGDLDISGSRVEFLEVVGGGIQGRFRTRNASTLGSVLLSDTFIGRDLDLRRTQILQRFELVDTRVSGDLALDGVDLQGQANLRGVRVVATMSLADAGFHSSARFDDCSFGRTILRGATFDSVSQFENCASESLDLGEGRPSTSGRNRCGVTVNDWDTGHTVWHFACVSLRNAGRSKLSDAARYHERIWLWRRSRARRSGRQGACGVVRSVLSRVGWLSDCIFLRWTTAYGTSVTRTLLSWAVVILGFAVAYTAFGVCDFSNAESASCVSGFGKDLYFSIVTSTTLGLGDVCPTTALGRVLVSLEAIAGGLLMALVVFVFGRRVSQ